MSPPALDRWMKALPVGEAMPALASALQSGRSAVLEAPTGAGKTTLVPLALLAAPWLDGRRLIMLEPRRLAARTAARRMADMLGERVGETVGYRTRLDSRIGRATRIEVVTEGILLRLLQDDPSLDGVGALIFDEFHERSLDADLGLALALDLRRYLREDLRIVVMSATLDGAPVARLLGDAAIVTSSGRSFPVALRYLDRAPSDRLEEAVAAAIGRGLREEEGSMLVFLPGGAEIRRVERLIAERDLGPEIMVAPLYGDLPQAAQDEAIRAAPAGRRKIVLATPIAETSLTIEGIRIVVDSGLRRAPRFDPRSGMTRLETTRISQASAEQRRGRAGRLAPGVCYRLWREAEQAQLRPHTVPEILEADLAPVALELAGWGNGDPAALAWLDPPPPAAYAQAQNLLRELGALDGDFRMTAHGRAMAKLGLHPRLAHMLLIAQKRGRGGLAADIAALLGERDILNAAPGQRDADLRLRLDLVAARSAAGHLPPGLSFDRGGAERIRQSARLLRHRLHLAEEDSDRRDAGRLLALAYPDRIAQRRAGASGQFRLANGSGAELPAADALASEEFLAVADLDGDRRNARIFLAAPLTRAEIEEDFADLVETVETIGWDDREEAVLSRRQERLGALVLREERLPDPPGELVVAAMIDGIRRLGLAALPWTREAESLRQRVRFLRRLEGEGSCWPDLSDDGLLAGLDSWLGPFLPGVTRRSQLARLDLAAALLSLLDWDRRRALDRLAPTHVTVPSGSRLPIDYGAGEVPVLAVRLQEMFGASETPAVAEGRVPLLLHLLSPAGRPLQVTRDLGGFWTGSYPAVRSEMRGRYPKHSWPEDPLAAAPTARVKRPAR